MLCKHCVKVLASEVRVAGTVNDEEGALVRVKAQQGDIQGAASKVVHQHQAVTFVVMQPVRNGGRYGLLYQSHKREAGLVGRPDSGSRLVVVKADRHRHSHTLELETHEPAKHTASILGRLLHSPQQPRSYLLRWDLPAVHHRHSSPFWRLSDFILQGAALELYQRVFVVQADKPLSGVDHVTGVDILEGARCAANRHSGGRNAVCMRPAVSGHGGIEIHH
mmetsp:Transcript_2635/g.7459  ORF Transcript_2635/g.7459 Transcript_2635/m.7459 type:complete len:221 (-) Transcript_2635:258-920(-)